MVTNHITSLHATENGRRQGIILATARILVRDKNGIPIVCRALLDGGSMSNFITKKKKISTKFTTKYDENEPA